MLKPNDMPAADTIIDYGELGIGPAMWHWSIEGDDLARIAREWGFDAEYVSMENDLYGDADQQLMKDYEAGDHTLPARWRPKPIAGWTLAAVHDTEDGPVAWFIRPIAKALPQEGKTK